MTDIEQLIASRARDLGGLVVGRVLPALHKRSVGPYLFLDHMGPADASEISVRPHPHIHLATVTYLFDGEIRHRDSLGNDQRIEPGAINWMSAGKGIVHSERSERPQKMHGLQLWVGLPEDAEDTDPSFVHHPAESLPVISDAGAEIRVLVGESHGESSPVQTLSPMFYLDVRLEPGARVTLPSGHAERAAYVVEGAVTVGNERIEPARLAVFARGASPELVADRPTRLVLLGGEPLGTRYMWWNFVSSRKERIVEAAQAWRAGQFPTVPGDDVEHIPAPDDDPRFATTD
jgi:redox-sensitive bicupin YhaK (pirin superfamily)